MPLIFVNYLIIFSIQTYYAKSDDLLNLTIIGTNENITQEEYRKSGNYFDYICIDVKSGISHILDEAFVGSSALKTIFLPKTLLSIGASAFTSCSNLAHFELPPNIKRIEDNTFMSCLSLPNLTIPAKCEYVGTWHTFMNCNSLHKFEVDSKNQHFYASMDGKILISIDGTAVACVGAYSEIIIPKGVISIGQFFANGRGGISDIKFESGSKCISIMLYAFRYTQIKSIEIPEGVETLGGAIFDMCPIRNVTLPSTLVSVDNYVFSGSISISHVNVPKNCSALKIDDSGVVFNSDNSRIMFMPTDISEFIIPKNVLNIAAETLRSNKKLVSIKTEENHAVFSASLNLLYNESKTLLISSIGGNKDVIIDSKCIRIGGSAFEGTDVQHVTILGNISSLGIRAFYNCQSLVSLDLMHVTEILDYSLNLCGITSITLSNVFNTIGNSILHTSKITSVDMSQCEKIKVLPSRTFCNCYSLATLKLPPLLEEIGDSLCTGCKLDSITLPCTLRAINSSAFESSLLNNLIFQEGESQLTRIGDKAFSNCNFDSFVAPDSIREIGIECFKGCSSLSTLTFSENSRLTSIPGGIIKGTKVSKIFIGKNVSSVTAGALSEAYELTEIVVSGENRHFTAEGGILYSVRSDCLVLCGGGLIKVSVKPNVVKIVDSAFLKCVKLTDLRFESGSELESIGPSTFFGCTSLESISFPSLLNTIEGGAFEGCRSLHTAEFPAECRVQSIGSRSFFGCESLREVVFSSMVQSIGASSFEGCKMLSRVLIGIDITAIGERAFADCVGLRWVEICLNGSRNVFIASNVFEGCKELDWVIISDSFQPSKVGGVPALRVLDRNCKRPTGHFTSKSESIGTDLSLLISVVLSDSFWAPSLVGNVNKQTEASALREVNNNL